MLDGWNEMVRNLTVYPGTSLLILVSCLSFYYFIFRRFYIDIWDPLFFSLISSALAAFVPFFMYFLHQYSQDIFYYSFLLTEIFYILGLLCFLPYARICNKYSTKCQEIKFPLKFKQTVYYIYTAIYVIVKLLDYYIVGIPILTEGSRQAMHIGGYGIFRWLNNALIFPLLFICIDSIFCKVTTRWYNSVVMTFIIVTLLLSDAKSSILLILQVLFFYKLYLIKHDTKQEMINELNKWYKKFMVLAIVGMLLPLLVKVTGGDFFEATLNLFIRIIAFGDIFAYFYSDYFADTMKVGDPLMGFIGPVLGIFRIVDYSQVPVPIGFQIIRAILENDDFFGGPNPRHNVFGFLYFGFWGAPIYSFVIGLITGYVCRFMYKKIRSLNIFSFILYAYFYYTVTLISSDWLLFFCYIVTFFVINVCFFGIAFLCYLLFNKRITIRKSELPKPIYYI